VIYIIVPVTIVFLGSALILQRQPKRALEQGVPPQAVALDGSWVTTRYSEAVKPKDFLAGSRTVIF
jgi:hypothetical protein